MQKPEPIDVIIPTYDNYNQLSDCVQSLAMTRVYQPVNVIIVNNGTSKIDVSMPEDENFSVKVIDAKENLGWIGGLQEGLKHSTAKYVLFANDDIFIPRASIKCISEMTRTLNIYPMVGAVGPSSNVVMGTQNMWIPMPSPFYEVTFLVGFCVMVRREALEKAGGVQDMEFGGDDLDLSIRLRKAGYSLIARRDIFVFHHGFQTGNRVHGGPEKANGWNSRNMTDNVNMELIRKHGFMEWWNTMINKSGNLLSSIEDAEREVVRSFVNGDKMVVEVGCGARKSVDHAIGVDLVPKGENSPFINQISVADIVANVEKELPFYDKSIDCLIARHILEHVVDPVKTLNIWKEKIRDGGKLIISCPDERIYDTIPMNPEHKHAFTPESLINLTELMGFKGKSVAEGYNQQSFTICLEKI